MVLKGKLKRHVKGFAVTRFAKIAMAGVAVVAIASGAAAFTGLIPLPGDDASPGAEAAHAGYPPEDEVVTTLDEIVVDISTRSVTDEPIRRFLKADLALVYRDEAGAKHGEDKRTHLRDAFVDYLRQLDGRDIAGSAGLARLRADLLHRARVLMGPDAPVQVLIADLVMQ